MNITFLIGNGFDLRLGMKTRYAEVYETYVKTESSSQCVAKFKEDLIKDEPSGYKTWADFEMAMARYACTFQSSVDFISCIRDFKEHMAKHLSQQEETTKKEIIEEPFVSLECTKEFEKSILNFYKGLSMNVINEIDGRIKEATHITYGALTFNYTTIFDQLYKRAASNLRTEKNFEFRSPLHIHGRLNQDIVLGVDNLDQLNGVGFPISKSMERAFLKPIFNVMYDKKRMDDALELVMKSDIICAYGLSLGESDLMWRNALLNWLLADSTHHLIYYQYIEQDFPLIHRDLIMDEEERLCGIFLERLTDNRDERRLIEDRVHIPVGYNIFDIPTAVQVGIRKKSNIRRNVLPA